MSKYTWTIEQLQDAVKSSTSFRQVLQKLNVVPAGGNYASLRRAVKKFSVDTSHFTGKVWNKGLTFPGRSRPVEDYLNNKFPIPSDRLKKRLISEGILLHMCSSCGLEDWLGDPVPLELDHINGDHGDNTLSNLRLLCPNCHAFTPGYRRRKAST